VEPVLGWYVPAAQLEHTLDDAAEYEPAGQESVTLDPPVQKLPAGHATAALRPVVAQYVDPAQVTQDAALEACW
jgi:hypothetical protein